VASLDDLRGRRILANPLHAQYVAPGFLLFQNGSALFAQPFDLAALAVTGEPAQIADDLAFTLSGGRGSFSASDSGALTYRAAGALAQRAELVQVDRSGGSPVVLGDPAAYRQIALSPDEQILAFTRTDVAAGRNDLWTMALATGITSRVTYNSVSSDDPIWRPDSRAIAYVSAPTGLQQFHQQALGSREASPIYESPEIGKFPHDWSRDGRFLLFHQGRRLFVLPMTGERTPRLLRETQGSVDSGRFSPDGRWIAYGSNESGPWEVYVAPFPAFDHSRQVSSRGGVQPRWRDDSRELLYLDLEGQVMSVSVGLSPTPSGSIDADAPVALFRSPIPAPSATIDQWVATRDGRRFFFIQPRASAASASPIIVVLNWPAVLPARQ
jgi:Tol biopolymer transport system component